MMRLLPREPDLGWTRYAWLIYVPMLLVDPIATATGPGEWSITIASILVFLVLYFRAYWVDRRRVVAYLFAIASLGAGMLPINPAATVYFIFAAGFLGRVASVRLGVRILLVLLATLVVESWLLQVPAQSWVFGLVFTTLIGGINIHFGQVGRANAKLRLAQDEVTHLAKVAERERIARDLHDLLGHTLSLIILKSEVAAKLADRDPARAAREIKEVEAISRNALAEVRSAVTGYRAGSLAGEVASSARTLEGTGLKVETVIGAVQLTPAQEGVLALAVREAVTNVIRHANAKTCSIRLEQQGHVCLLEVQDDGRGGFNAEGAGLSGMRERVEAIGGTLERNGAVGTRLLVRIPAPVELGT